MIRHLTAVWTFRHFLLSLVSLDVRRRYRRSAVGLGWSFITPVAMAFVFVLVFSDLLGADPRTYTTFLLLGMAVWSFFKECAVAGSQSLLNNEAYIRQSPLPFGLYPLRSVLGIAVHAGIGLGVALAAVVILNGTFAPLAILWAVVPALGLALLAGWAVATIFSFAHVYFHDTPHLLEVGAQVLFFLTPIIYRPEVLAGRYPWLLRFNPVNLFLELIRTPLLTGEPAAAKAYVYAVAGTMLLFGLAAATIAGLRRRVIFHM